MHFHGASALFLPPPLCGFPAQGNDPMPVPEDISHSLFWERNDTCLPHHVVILRLAGPAACVPNTSEASVFCCFQSNNKSGNGIGCLLSEVCMMDGTIRAVPWLTLPQIRFWHQVLQVLFQTATFQQGLFRGVAAAEVTVQDISVGCSAPTEQCTETGSRLRVEQVA